MKYPKRSLWCGVVLIESVSSLNRQLDSRHPGWVEALERFQLYLDRHRVHLVGAVPWLRDAAGAGRLFRADDSACLSHAGVFGVLDSSPFSGRFPSWLGDVDDKHTRAQQDATKRRAICCAEADERARRCGSARVVFWSAGTADLERTHVFSARSLGTTADDVRYALSLTQLAKGNTLNAGHVEENVVARRGLDEAEALIRDSLDRSFSHLIVSLDGRRTSRGSTCPPT